MALSPTEKKWMNKKQLQQQQHWRQNQRRRISELKDFDVLKYVCAYAQYHLFACSFSLSSVYMYTHSNRWFFALCVCHVSEIRCQEWYPVLISPRCDVCSFDVFVWVRALVSFLMGSTLWIFVVVGFFRWFSLFCRRRCWCCFIPSKDRIYKLWVRVYKSIYFAQHFSIYVYRYTLWYDSLIRIHFAIQFRWEAKDKREMMKERVEKSISRLWFLCASCWKRIEEVLYSDEKKNSTTTTIFMSFRIVKWMLT